MDNSNKLFNKIIEKEKTNLTLNDETKDKTKQKILDGNFKPKFFEDIRISPLFENAAQEIYCVGTIESDNYLKIDKGKLEFMKTLLNITDGEKTIDEIDRTLSSIYAVSSYRQFFTMLGEYGLLKNYNLNRKSDMSIFSINLFQINIKKFCISIRRYVPALLAIFKMSYIFIFSLFLALIITNSIDITTMFETKNNSSFQTLILIFIYIVPSIVVHELSHMIVAINHNLTPKYIKYSLYMLIYPIIYVVIPGIYFLKREERIWVLSAGVIWNSFFMFVCIVVGNIFDLDLLKILAYSNLILIVINLIPFFLSDGYFILSNILKTSNMRKDFTLFIMSFTNKNIDRKKLFSNKFSIFYILMSLIFLIYGMYGVGVNAASTIYEFLASRSINLDGIYFLPISIFFSLLMFSVLMFTMNKNSK